MARRRDQDEYPDSRVNRPRGRGSISGGAAAATGEDFANLQAADKSVNRPRGRDRVNDVLYPNRRGPFSPELRRGRQTPEPAAPYTVPPGRGSQQRVTNRMDRGQITQALLGDVYQPFTHTSEFGWVNGRYPTPYGRGDMNPYGPTGPWAGYADISGMYPAEPVVRMPAPEIERSMARNMGASENRNNLFSDFIAGLSSLGSDFVGGVDTINNVANSVLPWNLIGRTYPEAAASELFQRDDFPVGGFGQTFGR